jgi:aldehyde dehydrogenase (NAD+)
MRGRRVNLTSSPEAPVTRQTPAVDLTRHEAAAKLLPTARLVIGGDDLLAGSGGVHQHVNPATGRAQAEVPLGGALEVELAVAAARSAYETVWGPMRPADRRALLTRFADLLAGRRDDFATIATLEMGLCASMSRQIDAGIEWTHYYAGWADKIEGLVASGFSPADEFGYTLAEPYGVIGHIITWNAPLLSLGMKVPASLAAGNTVVIKPAEFTPFTALLFAELAREAGIPDGVVNVVQGSGPAGEALVRHQGVGKVSFTGGPDTAKRIMTTAAETLKPVLFELGGKSANLLFADADLATAAPYSAAFAMSCVGQGCALPTRLLVEESIYDEVVETVVGTVEALPLGDPLDPASYFGPLVNAAAQQRVTTMIDEARTSGAGTLRTGGSTVESDGFFVEPTVFVDVDNRSELAQREVFGPVLAITKFRDEDHAVELANDTAYGLSAYVQSRDVHRINRLVPRLRAGTVFVNQGPNPITQPGRPFGGVGLSGFGREGGKAGLDEFLMVKGVGVGRS